MITFTEDEKQKNLCYLKIGVRGHLNILAGFYVNTGEHFRVKLLAENILTNEFIELTEEHNHSLLFKNQVVAADIEIGKYRSIDLLRQVSHDIRIAFMNDKYVNIITLDIDSFEKIVYFAEL